MLMRRLVLSNESGECETSAEGVVLGRPSRPVGPVEVRVDLSLQSSIVWFFSWVPNSVFGYFHGLQTVNLVLFMGSELCVWFFSWVLNCEFGSLHGFQTVCLVFSWVPNCVFGYFHGFQTLNLVLFMGSKFLPMGILCSRPGNTLHTLPIFYVQQG